MAVGGRRRGGPGSGWSGREGGAEAGRRPSRGAPVVRRRGVPGRGCSGQQMGSRGKRKKKARLRQARRLLIVPFKTKIFAFNMLDNFSILLGSWATGQVLLLVQSDEYGIKPQKRSRCFRYGSPGDIKPGLIFRYCTDKTWKKERIGNKK